MGVTVIGRSKEEIKHLLEFASQNLKDIKGFLIIHLISSEENEEKALKEMESLVKESVGDTPYEVQIFTGSIDIAIETFLAKREDMRIVMLHVKKLDIKEILEEDQYTEILKKMEKGVLRMPVVFVPHG